MLNVLVDVADISVDAVHGVHDDVDDADAVAVDDNDVGEAPSLCVLLIRSCCCCSSVMRAKKISHEYTFRIISKNKL